MLIKITKIFQTFCIKQSTQIFVLAPFFLSVGVALYFGKTSEPIRMIDAFIIGSFSFIASGFFYFKSQSIHSRIHAALSLCVCLIAFGFGLADYRTHILQAPMIEKKIFGAMVTGTIIDIEKQERATRFYIKVKSSDHKKISRLNKIRISKRGGYNQALRAGDLVSFKAVLNPPSPPLYPGGYDFQRVAYFQQIGAVGYTISDIELIKAGKKGSYLFENLRQMLSVKIYDYVDDDARAAVINAFMTGEKKAIPGDTLEFIRDSGLAHLLAISGLHVGFVAGIVFFFIRALLAAIPYCALEWPIKKIAAVFALLAATYFTIIVGAAVPTQRALIMTGLVLFAVLIDRTAISMRLVALAALIILIAKPEELLNLSFQFSFAAVIALVGFYQGFRPYVNKLYGSSTFVRRILLYFLGLSLTSIIAGLATGPLALYYFNHFPLYGLLANMLAVPVMGMIVMPFVLLSYIFVPLGLESLSLSIVEYGVQWIIAVADYTAHLKGAVIHLPSWSFNAFILFILSGVFLFLLKGLEAKAVAVLLFVIGTIIAYKTPQPNIILDERLEVMAVKDDQGSYWFSNIQKNKFMTSIWADRVNQKEKFVWGKGNNSPVICDRYSCIYKMKNVKIAFPKEIQAYKQDCKQSDFIITRKYFNYRFGCEKSQWLSTKEWRNEGVVTLFYDERSQSFTIKTVQDYHGQRPWRR